LRPGPSSLSVSPAREHDPVAPLDRPRQTLLSPHAPAGSPPLRHRRFFSILVLPLSASLWAAPPSRPVPPPCKLSRGIASLWPLASRLRSWRCPCLSWCSRSPQAPLHLGLVFLDLHLDGRRSAPPLPTSRPRLPPPRAPPRPHARSQAPARPLPNADALVAMVSSAAPWCLPVARDGDLQTAVHAGPISTPMEINYRNTSALCPDAAPCLAHLGVVARMLCLCSCLCFIC
jgi:hypothetical protein